MSEQEEVKNTEELENRLASARLAVAQQIVHAENAPYLMDSLNKLCMTYIGVSEELDTGNKASKQKAKNLRKTADEIFTVLMCAMYNKMNSLEG